VVLGPSPHLGGEDLARLVAGGDLPDRDPGVGGIEGAPERLAVDRHHSGPVRPRLVEDGGEAAGKRRRVRQAEQPR
jgi:hypothetical protein